MRDTKPTAQTVAVVVLADIPAISAPSPHRERRWQEAAREYTGEYMAKKRFRLSPNWDKSSRFRNRSWSPLTNRSSHTNPTDRDQFFADRLQSTEKRNQLRTLLRFQIQTKLVSGNGIRLQAQGHPSARHMRLLKTIRVKHFFQARG